MQRFVEHRKQRIRERIEHLPLQEGVDGFFDILKLDLIEDLKISDNLLLESVEGKALHSILVKDAENVRVQLEQIIDFCRDHFFTGLLEEAEVLNPVKDLADFQTQLDKKIGQFIQDLQKQVAKIIKYSSGEEEAPAAAGPPTGRERVTGEPKGYYRPVSMGGEPTGGYSYAGAGQPLDPALTGRAPLPDVPEGKPKPSWWKRLLQGVKGLGKGFKNIGQQGWEGVKRAWRGELFPKESFEVVEGLIFEANVNVLDSISRIGKELRDFISSKSRELTDFISKNVGQLSGQYRKTKEPPTIDDEESWSKDPKRFLKQLAEREPEVYKHWSDDVGEEELPNYIKQLFKTYTDDPKLALAALKTGMPREEPAAPEIPAVTPAVPAEIPAAEMPGIEVDDKEELEVVPSSRTAPIGAVRQRSTTGARLGTKMRSKAEKAEIEGYGIDPVSYEHLGRDTKVRTHARDLMRAILDKEGEAYEEGDNWKELAEKHFGELYKEKGAPDLLRRLKIYLLNPQSIERDEDAEAPPAAPTTTAPIGAEQEPTAAELPSEEKEEEREDFFQALKSEKNKDLYNAIRKRYTDEQIQELDPEEMIMKALEDELEEKERPEGGQLATWSSEELEDEEEPEPTGRGRATTIPIGVETGEKKVIPPEAKKDVASSQEYLDMLASDEIFNDVRNKVIEELPGEIDPEELPSAEELGKAYVKEAGPDISDEDRIESFIKKAFGVGGDTEVVAGPEQAAEPEKIEEEFEGDSNYLSEFSKALGAGGEFAKEWYDEIKDGFLRGVKDPERKREIMDEEMDNVLANASDMGEYYTSDERNTERERFLENNPDAEGFLKDEEDDILVNIILGKLDSTSAIEELKEKMQDLRERLGTPIEDEDEGELTPEEEELINPEFRSMKPESFGEKLSKLQKNLKERKVGETTFETIKKKLVHP